MKDPQAPNGGEGETVPRPEFSARQRQIAQVIRQITPLALRGEEEGYEYEGHAGRRKAVQRDIWDKLTKYAEAKQPGHIFEMGTAYGLSGLLLLLGAPNARLTTVEMEPTVAKQAQAHFDEAGVNATVVADTVINTIAKLDTTDIDLVMIDHDKEHYGSDFRALEPHLAVGALILADNATDRRKEMDDFIEYLEGSPQFPDAHIEQTNAGLLVATYHPAA